MEQPQLCPIPSGNWFGGLPRPKKVRRSKEERQLAFEQQRAESDACFPLIESALIKARFLPPGTSLFKGNDLSARKEHAVDFLATDGAGTRWLFAVATPKHLLNAIEGVPLRLWPKGKDEDLRVMINAHSIPETCQFGKVMAGGVDRIANACGDSRGLLFWNVLDVAVMRAAYFASPEPMNELGRCFYRGAPENSFVKLHVRKFPSSLVLGKCYLALSSSRHF